MRFSPAEHPLDVSRQRDLPPSVAVPGMPPAGAGTFLHSVRRSPRMSPGWDLASWISQNLKYRGNSRVSDAMEGSQRVDLLIACALNVFDEDEEKRHLSLSLTVRSSCVRVQELSDGFAFQYPADPALYLRLAEWVTLERKCCSFLTFDLEFGRGGGPIWLRLTGREGAKGFLRSYMNPSKRESSEF